MACGNVIAAETRASIPRWTAEVLMHVFNTTQQALINKPVFPLFVSDIPNVSHSLCINLMTCVQAQLKIMELESYLWRARGFNWPGIMLSQPYLERLRHTD
jgi:hypothetical protein